MMGYWADRGGAISDLEAARFGGVRSYLDRPGLVAYERRYVGNATAGFRSLEGIDIIRNPSRVVATEPGTSPASLHLYQGVVETALERLLVEIDPAAEPDVGADPTVSRSTYNVFAAAKQAQISAVVLDGTAESLNVLEGLAIPESAKANIARDLVGGYVVIVPERAIELAGTLEIGWWRVSRADGNTLGIMQGGRGQALTEKAILLSFVFHIALGMCLDEVSSAWGAGLCGVGAAGATVAASGATVVRLYAGIVALVAKAGRDALDNP